MRRDLAPSNNNENEWIIWKDFSVAFFPAAELIVAFLWTFFTLSMVICNWKHFCGFMNARTALGKAPYIHLTKQTHRLIIIIISDLFAVIGLDFRCNYWKCAGQGSFPLCYPLEANGLSICLWGFLMKFSLFYTRTMGVIIIPVRQSVSQSVRQAVSEWAKSVSQIFV